MFLNKDVLQFFFPPDAGMNLFILLFREEIPSFACYVPYVQTGIPHPPLFPPNDQ